MTAATLAHLPLQVGGVALAQAGRAALWVIARYMRSPLTNSAIAWDRTRSSASTCAESRPEVVAGGATYRLSVQLGELTSQTDAPFLLY